MNALFALLLARCPVYPPDKWQAWVLAHNVNQAFASFSERKGFAYSFWRVEMLPHELESKLAEFPGLVAYIRSLPIMLEKVIVISQIPEAPMQWHHDFDIGGTGIRICLAGEDDGGQEVLPTSKPLDAAVWDIAISRPPFTETEYGHLRQEFIPYVDPSRIFKPKGVRAGVAWLITSWWGLHRVLPVKSPRIQCILRGRIDYQALAPMVDADTVVKAF
jgi:hypothetical protein